MTGPVNYLTAPGRPDVGRWAELNDEPEVAVFDEHSDLRHPRYRREVFLRFYEFHLAYRTHPGCVYLAFPWLQRRFGLDREQMLWMAFINGNTQNIVTTARVFRQFPDLKRLDGMAIKTWFEEHYRKLAFDTDRRYHKKDFLLSVERYRRLTGGEQEGYFAQHYSNRGEGEAFQNVWRAVRRDFHTFGRLSAFSYLEYLRIVGLPLVCGTLFLTDMDGSKSHRNGLARVLGRDDIDWHASTGFDGSYSPDHLPWLEREAELLMSEARARCALVPDVDPRDVNYFTLESAFCTFKSWFRPNRRYPNCLAEGTLILSPEGDVPIEELEGNRYPVYTMNEETGDIVFSWATGFFSGEAETVIIELDDGSEIEATSDHLFMTRKRTGPPENGITYSWVKAAELTPGVRLSPLHRFISNGGYSSYYSHRTATRDSWRFVHTEYYKFMTGEQLDREHHIHHKNDIKTDPSFLNLEKLTRTEHIQKHKNKSTRENYQDVQTTWKGRKPHSISEFELIEIGRAILEKRGALTCEIFAEETKGKVSVYVPVSRWGRWSNYLSVVQNNHKVVNVRPGRRTQVFDLSVENNHNFYIGSGVLVHNCYADMMADRVRYAEAQWGKGLLTNMFWRMREDSLPGYLRQEFNPRDPGVVPAKQNYFRETGRPVMMSRRWPEFDCEFDRGVWS